MLTTLRSLARRRGAPLLAVPAAIAGLLLVSGCGDGVPSDAVANVSGDTIDKSLFDHWLGSAAKSQQPPGTPPSQAVVPDPPTFAKCVKAQLSQPVPQGAPKPTAAQAKSACQQEYDALKRQVLGFLISSKWIQKEADARGVTVSDAVVRKQFEDEKKKAFPNDQQYKQFLQRSGQTEGDILFRLKMQMLENQLQKKVIAGKDTVPPAEIAAYYNQHKSDPPIAQPERREVEVVLTKDMAKAQQARQAIESGQSFASVAKKFSIDPASKAQGGKLPPVTKGQGQLEQGLDQAVFSAPKGKLVGPVKAQFGYYVFKVTNILPPSQQTLAQATDTIRNQLRSQKQQKALTAFRDQFVKKYKDETTCAKEFLLADFCKNAPKPKKGQGGAQGPGGAAPVGPGGGGGAPSPQPSPSPGGGP